MPAQTRARPADWPASAQSRRMVPMSRLFTFLVSDITRRGGENFPPPPFVLVANHPSRFDLAAAVPLMPCEVVFLSAHKYKNTRWEPFFELSSVIWIRQDTPDHRALRAALRVLGAGAPVGLAPEGQLSDGGGLREGHKGAAFLARRTRVPIVPCAIWGSERIFKELRPRVHVQIGRPFYLPNGGARRDDLQEHTERIMCALAALLPESYHGFYAGHPLITEMARIVR